MRVAWDKAPALAGRLDRSLYGSRRPMDGEEHRRHKKEKKHHRHHHHRHKEEKHKEEKRKEEKHKKEKHKKEKTHSRNREHSGKHKRSRFAEFVELHPESREELCSLLQMLDQGQAIILDQVEDSALRARLLAALEALGLEGEKLTDGSVAYAAAEGSALYERHAHVLGSISKIESIAATEDADRSAAVGGEEAGGGEGAAAAGRGDDAEPRRAYGVAPPPAPASSRAIGPTMPSAADASRVSSDDEESESSSESGQVGPSLPDASVDLALRDNSGGGSSQLWWQREAAAPKPPSTDAADVKGGGPEGAEERDAWMVALPTERTDLNSSAQARQFSRTGVAAKGDLSVWTDTPADRNPAPGPNPWPFPALLCSCSPHLLLRPASIRVPVWTGERKANAAASSSASGTRMLTGQDYPHPHSHPQPNPNPQPTLPNPNPRPLL